MNENSGRVVTDVADASLRARSILRESPYPGIRELECQMEDADLMVRGQVGSFYLKQMALASLKNLVGIRRVVDQITVRNSSNAR